MSRDRDIEREGGRVRGSEREGDKKLFLCVLVSQCEGGTWRLARKEGLDVSL